MRDMTTELLLYESQGGHPPSQHTPKPIISNSGSPQIIFLSTHSFMCFEAWDERFQDGITGIKGNRCGLLGRMFMFSYSSVFLLKLCWIVWCIFCK